MTPIDWKPAPGVEQVGIGVTGHHSLVTPIDWKLLGSLHTMDREATSHHLLVTSIDWKQGIKQVASQVWRSVTTHW